MKRIFKAAAAVALLAAVPFSANSDDDAALLERAERLHDRIISLDTHTDSAIHLPAGTVGEDGYTQVTFEKLREGRMDCCFFPIYVGQKELSDEARSAAKRYAVEKMNVIRNYIVERRDEAAIAYGPEDLVKYKKEGKLCFVMGLENGFPIGRSLDDLRMFYNMGARIITLCHNYNNDICDASVNEEVTWHGLSPFGEQVVREMNRLGMIIDISHASTETLFDCLALSKAPIIASHSCVFNIKGHRRNLKDEEIRAIAAKGGVIQVTSGRWALSTLPREQVNISVFCDHVEYIRNLVGVDYVGVGTDFDGGGGMAQLEDASKMKYITVELMRRGWTDEELEKFWGGNLMRVWREIERVKEIE